VVSLPAITNPINGKTVEVRIAPLVDGIAGRVRDCSIDSLVIYIDPIVPESMYTTLVIHEYIEFKRLINGDKWAVAHQDANEIERVWVEHFGADWSAYNRNYIKLLRAIENRHPRPQDPDDMFRGESGEKVPIERHTEKGADVANIVTLGGQASPSTPLPNDRVSNITNLQR
jgi:hypothetical protein